MISAGRSATTCRSRSAIKFDRDYDYGDLGFRTHQLSMHPHNGTHVDAPEHTEQGGAHIDEIPPDVLYGPGVVLDLSPYADDDVEFTPKHIQAAETKLDEPIKPNDFVLLRSDWSSTYGTDRYWPKSPYLADRPAGSEAHQVDHFQPEAIG